MVKNGQVTSADVVGQRWRVLELLPEPVVRGGLVLVVHAPDLWESLQRRPQLVALLQGDRPVLRTPRS